MITLRPLNTNTWAGVTFFKNCHHDLCPYLIGAGVNRGLRYTGFESENKEEQALLNKTRKELEKKLNTDLSNSSPYWDTFFIRMRDEDKILHIEDNAYDELQYLFLKNHKDVKTSINQLKPSARYLLYDEENEAKASNLKLELKTNAFHALSQMTADEYKDCLRLYGIRSEDLSAEVAKKKLSEYVEQDPKKFLSLWVDNKMRKTQVIIEKCIGRGIIRRTNLMYQYGTTSLGKTMEEAISFIENENNQEIKIGILNALK